MHEQQGVRVLGLGAVDVGRGHADMGGTAAVDKVDLLVGDHAADIGAEVDIGNKNQFFLGQSCTAEEEVTQTSLTHLRAAVVLM